MRFTTFIVLAIVSVTPLLGWREASAAIAYTVSPLVIDVEAHARDIITRSITLTNTGSQQVTVFPSVNNISLREGGTIDAFLTPSADDRTASLSSWTEISRLGIDLQPGASRSLPITFRIHPDPVPGTYHALIGFGFGRNRDEAETQVKNGQAPGTVVTLTIPDERVEALKLARFSVDRFITSSENEAAVFTFKNPGDVPVSPHGEIILYDSKGKEVGAVPVNAEAVSINPGEEYSFKTSIPADGMLGKYKAFLSVEYGDMRATVHDTSFYYVFPWKAVLIALLILALLAGFISSHYHHRYLDEDDDDSDRLTFHIRDTKSESKDHDINLKST